MNSNAEKIGIVTLPGAYNYGNRLQCYAVCEAYKALGRSPVVLVRRTSRIKRLAKRALGREWRTAEELMDPARAERFKKFDDLIPRRYVKRPYTTLKDSYRYFSVGSDQTWNPKYMGRDASWYFLRFAKRGQRIAIAPSIGVGALDEAERNIIQKGVRGFDRLSVREWRGAELIKECAGRDAEVVCDPTLVINAKKWRSLACSELTPSQPYIFAYLLGGASSIPGAVLCDGEERYPVVTLSDRDRDGEVPAGPAEFISLVDNAAHVITDSFHAAVFSCILQTPLTIIRREGDIDIFSRLETLSEMLGLEHKIYGSESFDLSRAGDYEHTERAIERERGKFMSYLEACLNG